MPQKVGSTSRNLRLSARLIWPQIQRMKTFRIALANLRHPSTPAESVMLAEGAVAQAGAEGAAIVCFPECFIPGYRSPGKVAPAADPAFLESAWATVAAAAAKAGVAVILGTERVVEE